MASMVKGFLVVRNVHHVLSRIKKFEKHCASAAIVGMEKSLKIVEGECLRLVSKGELRAVDTGLMRSTLDSDITKVTPDLIEGEVGVGTYYAFWVHEGTTNMRGRPFLVQGLKNKKVVVDKTMRNHIKRELQGLKY